VVILVVGDVFGATTHTDLFLRAKAAGVQVQVVHNASIINAVGAVGLELYRYGKTVSIPYWSKGYEPTSFLDGIKENHDRGLHTLCLLDIKADEHRFMSVSEGVELLDKAQAREGIIISSPFFIGVARLGCPDQKVVVGAPEELQSIDFGKPPHCLIIPGKLHLVEEEMLELWRHS
jgi:diphthine methyl ester synthase